MATPESSKTLNTGEWVALHEYSDIDERPVSYGLEPLSGGSGVEVFVVPLHGQDAPTGGTQGVMVPQGSGWRNFIERTESGSGAIRGVYAKSDDAVITHGADIG